MEKIQESIEYFCNNNPGARSDNDQALPGDFRASNLVDSFADKLCRVSGNSPSELAGSDAMTLEDGDATLYKFEILYNMMLPFLNNYGNKTVRYNAYLVLYMLLEKGVQCSSNAQSVFVSWIQERIINDTECFAVLLGITKFLLKSWTESISEYDVRVWMQKIFENIPVQQMPVMERRSFFELMEWLVNERPRVCQLEFLLGYIQVIDGERDPLILNKSFRLFPRIARISGHHVDQNAEDIFDVFSCYFPVHFNPPKKDPHGVTKESLSEGLLETLAASPSFAEFALPFFEEKISSPVVETKIESLKAVAHCIKHYGEDAIRHLLRELWGTIRTEVLRSTQHEVHHASIEAITLIARVVSTPDLGKDLCLSNLESVLLPGVQEIRSPECKMASQFSEMIASVAASSEWNCALVTEYIIPQIYDLFLEVKTTPKRSGIIVIGKQILSTLVFFPQLHEASQLASQKMFEIAFSLKEDYNLKNDIIQLMSRLMPFEDILNHGEPSQYLLHILLNDGVHKKDVLDCLDWIINNAQKIEILKTKILVPLLSVIEKDGEKALKGLEVSCEIALLCPDIAPVCIDKYFSFFFQCIEVNDINSANNVLPTLKKCIEKSFIQPSQSLQYLQQIINLIVQRPGYIQKATLLDLCDVSQVLFSCLGDEEQVSLGCDLLKVLIGNNNPLTHFSVPEGFNPYASHIELLILSARCLLYLRKSLFSNGLVHGDFSALSLRLLTFARETSDDNFSEQVAHLVSSILNKIPAQDLESVFNNQILPLAQSQLGSQGVVEVRSIKVFSWILKALVMRPDSNNFSVLLNSLFLELISHPESSIAFAAANGFGVVMRDEVLNKDNDSNFSIFYKQRFFLQNVGSLLQKYSTLEAKSQGPVLEAVANLIQSIPSKVLTQHVGQLYPLVYAAVRGDNEDVIQSGLNTLQILFEESEEYCQDKLHELIPVLLRLSCAKVRMSIRCTALQCIQNLALYSYPKIYPFQNTVLRGLRGAIDDKKRIVRKEAVIARNRWYVLNQ